MSGMNPGFAAYLARKKAGGTLKTNSATITPNAVKPLLKTTAVLPTQMVSAIKASPKGKLPPGLAKYMAARKAKGGM